MEREGEGAGGRSMQRLILCLCVCFCASAKRLVTYRIYPIFTYFLLLHIKILYRIPSHGFFPRGLATQKRVWYRVCSCTNLRALVSFSFIHTSLLNPFKISYRIPLHGFFPFSFTRVKTPVPNSDASIPPGSLPNLFPYWIPT